MAIMRKVQQVYRGKTESGIEGLFTNGTLALTLSRIGHETFDAMTETEKREYCARYDLQYIQHPEDE